MAELDVVAGLIAVAAAQPTDHRIGDGANIELHIAGAGVDGAVGGSSGDPGGGAVVAGEDAGRRDDVDRVNAASPARCR